MNNQLLSSELIIVPHQSGVRLARPEKSRGSSVGQLYKTPMSIYFLTQDSQCADVNEGAAELNGASSVNDLIMGDNFRYWDKGAVLEWKRNDMKVMQLQSLSITDDSGTRTVDDSQVQMITFKMPWYHHDKVIGIFGMTLTYHAQMINQFAKNLTSIIASGLVSSRQLSPLHKMTHENDDQVYFSKREHQILSLLVMNLTAKQIAEKLSLSKRTIEHHIENIKSKANVNSKFALIEKYYWKIYKKNNES